MKQLQSVLRESDSVATPNDDSLIQYFRKSLRPFIHAQLDAQSRDLDSWNEVVEKAVDTKAKASLQLYSKTREMDSKCPQGERLVKTDDFSEPKKNKSTHTFFAN